MSRIAVRKTYKLYVGGAFPRSESGRTFESEGQNVAWASRKDARDAVKAARGAFPKWSGATPYNRGQVVYRLAEMMEARAADLARACSGRREVERAIDRVVWYAGWADKLPQVLGGSNPVAGPYFNFTVPEPTGVVGLLAPDEPPLLGLVSRLAPALVGGNTVVAVASETGPLAAIELAEVLATSDLPGGVVNLLTGRRAELAHREPVPAHVLEPRRLDAVSTISLSPGRMPVSRVGKCRRRSARPSRLVSRMWPPWAGAALSRPRRTLATSMPVASEIGVGAAPGIRAPSPRPSALGRLIGCSMPAPEARAADRHFRAGRGSLRRGSGSSWRPSSGRRRGGSACRGSAPR